MVENRSCGKRGNEDLLFNGYRVGEDEKAMEIDSGNSCIII